MTATTQTGLVTASYGYRGILTDAAGDTHKYVLKGRKLRAVCGDRVHWNVQKNSGEVLVTQITARSNALARPDSRGKPETIAANVSCLAITLAPAPQPDFFIADRYLCAAEMIDASVILLWNKCDLATELPDEMNIYAQLGYAVIRCSAIDDTGIDKLHAALNEETAMLVGQSGVGKSSLINRLIPDADVNVGELSTATREGKHTTTASCMHSLPGGGRLIDSPGVRDFAPVIADINQVQSGFREIREHGMNCRFADCQHLREPDCAVKRGLDDGTIDRRRYESYKRLRNSVTQLNNAFGA